MSAPSGLYDSLYPGILRMDLPKPLLAVFASILSEEPEHRRPFQEIFEILEEGGPFSERTQTIDRDFHSDMQMVESFACDDDSDIFSDLGTVKLTTRGGIDTELGRGTRS
jgi:hypothetical protein